MGVGTVTRDIITPRLDASGAIENRMIDVGSPRVLRGHVELASGNRCDTG